MVAAHVFVMFEFVEIQHVVEVLFIDPDVVEQGAGFGGCPVTDDFFALGFQVVQDVEHLGFDGFNPLGESQIVIGTVHPQAFFRGQHLGYDRLNFLTASHEQAQGSAVDRQALDVIEIQIVTAEKGVQGHHRIVAQVLVVNGVELAMVDQVDQIGAFDNRHSVVLEHGFDAGHEAV